MFYECGELALGVSIVVRIKKPEVEHRVQIRDFYKWLEAAGRDGLDDTVRNILSK